MEKNILVPNKGDVLNYSNYRGIRLMDHATKLCERIIDEKLKHEKLKHELIYLKPIWSSSRKINSESYIHY